MAYQFSRKGCFKCGNLGHIAENCTSEQRLCYNCRQPGHESNACPAPRTVSTKQCYSCGGVGHIQAECPSLRIQGGNQKCYCPNGMGGGMGMGFASRAPPPGRGLNTSALPPVKCYRCGGPNHMARYVAHPIHSGRVTHLAVPSDCLAAPGVTADGLGGGLVNVNKSKTCYKCQQEGHIARECPENAEYVV
ncbi:hypothetical protein OF83DRAFT_1166503 [Amylostereum chailletii]|nr:hypothetical protein OF83DRAFT_1166503 [Amylostereum chailletii]